MALERRFGLFPSHYESSHPRRQVPNAQRVVVGAGHHVATIGCDCHGTDPAGMALERRFGFPRGQVPNA
jgi:hypothetical protein